MMILTVLVGFSIAMNVVILVYYSYRVRSFEQKINEIEMSVVRSVLDENPALVHEVLSTYSRIYGTSLKSKYSMKEARRLHGLPP